MVIGKSTAIQFFISITFLFLTLSSFAQSNYITDCSALPNVIEMDEEFNVYVVIKNGINLDSVVIQEPNSSSQPQSIFLDGENFKDITLYDDGLNGDETAGDNIFTRGGLSYDYTGTLSTQNQIIFRTENLLYYRNGVAAEETLDLTMSLAIYNASQIDEPTVTVVNDEVQFSTHTINVKRPARWGEDPFPLLDYWIDNPLLDNLLCDDLFILVQGTTNNMPVNTQIGASFLPTTTATQGLGRALSDGGYPFDGILTVNWTRSVETFMSHELLHKWGAYDDLYGNLSDGHWGWVEMESSGILSPSSFEFSDLKSLGNNTYEVKRNALNAKDKHWSDLELYLAGRISLDEVNFPIRFIDNAQVVGLASANPTTVKGTLTEISKADWLANVGPRVPANGPEEYKMVQVIFSDELLTSGQLSYFEESIRLSQRKILGPQYQFDPMTVYEASRGEIKLKSIYLPCTLCVDDDDDGICNEEDICPDGDDTLDSDNDGIPNACDNDNCILGAPCDDGNPCTEGDSYHTDCNCYGIWADDDDDGICNESDECPGEDDFIDENENGIPDGCDARRCIVGDPCDDGNDCTLNDYYTIDCNCIGFWTDTDDDGICNAIDECPYDYDNECDDLEYCESQGLSTFAEYIESVLFASMINESGNDGGYRDYTNISIPVNRGEVYDIALTPGFEINVYREYWSVWIDFNKDGDFDDGNELIFQGNSKTQISGTIGIPFSAYLGTTRMRVSMRYNSETAPCTNMNYGEVEDYTVSINAAIRNDIALRKNEKNVLINIYPNPVDEWMNVNLENLNDQGNLFIYDALGRQVLQQVVEPTKSDIRIDTSPFRSGIYTLILRLNNEELISLRFVRT